MAEFTVEEIVNRARVYIADDHDDNGGFISEERWVDIFNAEYATLYTDWVRLGLISPAPVEAAFTSYTTTVEGVLATIGVAENLGSGSYRLLTPAQSTFGRSPFWNYTEGTAQYWRAHGTSDAITYTLEPRVTANYVARYLAVPTPAPAFQEFVVSEEEEDGYVDVTVDLPYGCDERLVLGIARRAKLKDGSASALLERLMGEATAQLNFRAFGRANGDSPRVRRTRETAPRVTGWETDPRLWRYS